MRFPKFVMHVFKPRRRMVYFRLSEEEFQQLNDLCQLQGARSLSDLARSAVYQMLHNSNHAGDQDLVQRIQQLDKAISELNCRLQNVTMIPQMGSQAPSAAAAAGVEEER